MKPNRTPTPVKPETSPAVENQIRIRAYQLYEQRGKQDGHELDDWFQAESEVKQEIQSKNEWQPLAAVA